MPTSVLNHILALSRNFCLTAIIRDEVFICSGHTTLTQILLSVWHRKVLKSLLRGLFFYLIKINSALMQTFSLLCFSSSNRVGGVAHDCVKTASKSLFPDYKLPFALDREFFGYADCKIYKLVYPRKIRRRKRVGAKRSIIFLGCAVFKICLVHLFNSGLYSTWWSFYNQFRLSYFPLAFRLFPSGN